MRSWRLMAAPFVVAAAFTLLGGLSACSKRDDTGTVPQASSMPPPQGNTAGAPAQPRSNPQAP